MGTALIPVLFAYGGFESVFLPAGEAKNPRRDAPFALLGGLMIVLAGVLRLGRYLEYMPWPVFEGFTIKRTSATTGGVGIRLRSALNVKIRDVHVVERERRDGPRSGRGRRPSCRPSRCS